MLEKTLEKVVHHTLGWHAQTPSGRPWSRELNELIEWDVSWTVSSLTDYGLCGHRHGHAGLGFDGAEVLHIPRLIK